tara:strand:+ start:2210 stop:3469 length:1260 start_codon:yes stop_codon:yes gene_type:complete
MAASIIAKPTDLFTVADQHLIYQVESSVTITDSFRFVLAVYDGSVSVANLLGKFYLTANPQDYAYFNLSEVVRGLCEVDDRSYQETTAIHAYKANYMTRSNGNIRKFVVGAGEWNGTTETLNDDTETIQLIDGHFQTSQGLNPSFTDFYGTASTKTFWLTDRQAISDVITIDAANEDEGVVAFLNRSTISDVGKFLLTIYNAAGVVLSASTIDVNSTNGAQLPTASSPTNGFLVYFGVYPANLDGHSSLLTNNPTWSYYTLTPQATTGAVQEGNVLQINNRCTPAKNESVQIGWANTIGGWDYLRFNGRKLKTISREEKTYRKQIGDYNSNSFSFTPFDREITPYQVEAKETYQLNGILTSEEYDLFQYCFRSKNIMARIDGTWLPVSLKESSLQVESDTTSKVYIATINVELAQNIRC